MTDKTRQTDLVKDYHFPNPRSKPDTGKYRCKDCKAPPRASTSFEGFPKCRICFVSNKCKKKFEEDLDKESENQFLHDIIKRW